MLTLVQRVLEACTVLYIPNHTKTTVSWELAEEVDRCYTRGQHRGCGCRIQELTLRCVGDVDGVCHTSTRDKAGVETTAGRRARVAKAGLSHGVRNSPMRSVY